MLKADKEHLETDLKRSLILIEEKELNFYEQCLNSVGTQAALIAGFASAIIVETASEIMEDSPLSLQVFWIGATTLGMLLEIMCVVAAMQLSILVPGLALRGPDGSMSYSLSVCRDEYNVVIRLFYSGLAFFHLSGALYGWAMFKWEVALTATLLVMIGCVWLVWHSRKLANRLWLSRSSPRGSLGCATSHFPMRSDTVKKLILGTSSPSNLQPASNIQPVPNASPAVQQLAPTSCSETQLDGIPPQRHQHARSNGQVPPAAAHPQLRCSMALGSASSRCASEPKASLAQAPTASMPRKRLPYQLRAGKPELLTLAQPGRFALQSRRRLGSWPVTTSDALAMRSADEPSVAKPNPTEPQPMPQTCNGSGAPSDHFHTEGFPSNLAQLNENDNPGCNELQGGAASVQLGLESSAVLPRGDEPMAASKRSTNHSSNCWSDYSSNLPGNQPSSHPSDHSSLPLNKPSSLQLSYQPRNQMSTAPRYQKSNQPAPPFGQPAMEWLISTLTAPLRCLDGSSVAAQPANMGEACEVRCYEIDGDGRSFSFHLPPSVQLLSVLHEVALLLRVREDRVRLLFDGRVVAQTTSDSHVGFDCPLHMLWNDQHVLVLQAQVMHTSVKRAEPSPCPGSSRGS
eukprot:CAMPEP_0119331174 /NCGR_PEP_ID=MMETSP1333-20130426/79972_1 /TAXON_ID=418940 /ORGANISM="Scyphosphaera apsteinii, Strain RCC1455" /LENGTH=628 /DNA_ID=CAMNT_0007340705 /DNA_START=61 /DNA_END=1947 /DNA_ORIENTATION=+